MRAREHIIIGALLSVVVIIVSAVLIHKVSGFNQRTGTPVATSKQSVSEIATTEPESTTEEVTKPPLTDELLTLVNYAHPVPENWTVDLVEIQDGAVMDKRAADDFKEMMKAAHEAGVYPYVRNAYRSKSLQETVFENKVQEFIDSGYSREDAEEKAKEWVAYPGTSEHQLGLAADVVDDSYHGLTEKQEETDTQKWLMANAHLYGFILRYPNDKKDITRTNYEPWHYRYVGRENAQKIYDSGLCLEEYLEQNYDLQ